MSFWYLWKVHGINRMFRNVLEGPEYAAEYFGRFWSGSTEGHHEALGLMGPTMAGARERGGVPLQVGLGGGGLQLHLHLGAIREGRESPTWTLLPGRLRGEGVQLGL